VPSESLRRDQAVPLAEELLRVRERYLEVSLQLGGHREIVGELSTLTRENPWQESFWALYILALHRSGRQADALETYRDVHRIVHRRTRYGPPGTLLGSWRTPWRNYPCFLRSGPILNPVLATVSSRHPSRPRSACGNA
jgi:hypothetical protein